MRRRAPRVSGSDSDEAKEEAFLAFASGQIRVLVTKPKIGAWGLNFQHCAHVTFFPSHSFEQYYQGVRRCWRFGQNRPVVVDVVTTEGEREVLKNLRRKAAAADRMFSSVVAEMNRAIHVQRGVRLHDPRGEALMAVNDQRVTDRYAVYNGDCIEVMASFPSASVHLSIYSPPFGGLFYECDAEAAARAAGGCGDTQLHGDRQRLRTTQPALSASISQLEQALDIKLIDRTTRRFALTNAVIEFLPAITRILADIDSAIRNLTTLAALKGGSVIVGCAPAIVMSVLAKPIAGFRKRYPHINVIVKDAVGGASLGKLKSGELELAVASLPKPDPEFSAVPLFSDPIVAIVPKSSPLARKRSVTWRALADYPIIGALRAGKQH